jgi:hypothetical protein
MAALPILCGVAALDFFKATAKEIINPAILDEGADRPQAGKLDRMGEIR